MRDLVRGNVIIGLTLKLSSLLKLWRLVFHRSDHRGSALVGEMSFWRILKVSRFWLDLVELSDTGSRNASSFTEVLLVRMVILLRPALAPLVTRIMSTRPSGLAGMHRGALSWPRGSNC